MVLNIFATLLVLGITFIGSLFGLYSGMLNVACAVFALAVAFGYWEALDGLLAGTFHLHPSYTGPLALGLLFLVTLIALRLLADNFLRGNVRVPMYVDWGGGAVCGFLYGQIVIGVTVLALLMLPWGGRIMLFSRYERAPDDRVDDTGRVEFQRRALWLRSDEFAVGLFKLLSGGSLGGNTSFASVYPDFTQWVFWTGNQMQHEVLTAPMADDKVDGWGSKGLAVASWWEQKEPLPAETTRYRKQAPSKDNEKPPYEAMALRPADGKRLIGMRLALRDDAADVEGEYKTHRFRPSNIRLVGDRVAGEGLAPKPRQYAPQVIGGADANLETNYRIVDLDNNLSVSARGDLKIDVYFEVDEDFVPRFVEYRRRARAPVAATPSERAPEDRLALAGPAQPGRPGQPSGTGVARFIDLVLRNQTGDIDRLPFVLASNKITSLDIEIRDRKLVSIAPKTRLAGFRRDLEALGPQAAQGISTFALPEGKRIFQVQARTKRMESLLGQAINFAAATTNQYKAIDNRGNSHDLAGYYALVKKDGQDYIELFFTPNPSEVGYSGLLEFDPDVRRALREQDDAILGLIFVVPPETCIRVIQSQGGRSDFGQDMCVGKQ